jgi:hypothetical protein
MGFVRLGIERLRHGPSVTGDRPYATVRLLVLRDMPTPPTAGTGEPRSVLTGTAARLAPCHPATVRRAIERGDLEAFRLGPRGAWRITPDALHRWRRTPQAGENP